VPYARNFAVGLSFGTDPDILTTGTAIPWATIDSGAAPGIDVPITPQSTGIIRIHSVVSIKNASMAPVSALLIVVVNGTTLTVPLFELVVIPADGAGVLPVLTETTPILTPIGVQAMIEIVVFASTDSALSFTALSSSLEVQEVQAATG